MKSEFLQSSKPPQVKLFYVRCVFSKIQPDSEISEKNQNLAIRSQNLHRVATFEESNPEQIE